MVFLGVKGDYFYSLHAYGTPWITASSQYTHLDEKVILGSK